MLPSTLPLFPLPNTVLFPGVFLPLHVFEPRYRLMVEAALSADRMMGIVLLKPGWESDYEGRPPIYATGCAGVISHVERLPDGRYNLVLKGLEKIVVTDEDSRLPYRVGVVKVVPEILTPAEREQLRDQRQQLEFRVTRLEPAGTRWPETLGDEELVNTLSQYLGFEPVERLALLECTGAVERARLLWELIQLKAMASSRGVH